jgi:hypothetical protein
MAKKQKEEKVLDKIVEESNLQDFKSETEKPTKIEEQELAMIQSMIKTIEQLTTEIGQIEVRKHALMKAMEGVQTRLEGQRASIQTKYGTDNVNLQDGTISYPNPAPQNNPTENGEADKKD